jgi:hypothetical protein
MIRPSTWPWRSIAHHLGLQHHITISGNRGQRSREDLLWGAVGSIPGNRRNRRAIRVKHIGTLPLNPYCGLQLLKKHGNLSEWENSARSLPLGARRFPPDSKHLSISHSKVSCSADRQNDRLYHGFFEGSEHAGNDLASHLATPRSPVRHTHLWSQCHPMWHAQISPESC